MSDPTRHDPNLPDPNVPDPDLPGRDFPDPDLPEAPRPDHIVRDYDPGDPDRDDPDADGDDSALGDHDPRGLDLALKVARGLQDALPPPRGVTKRAARPRRDRPSRDAAAPAPVGELLDHLIQDRGWSTDVGLRQILARWSGLVGQTNAEHSKPESFADGILVVRADSSTWASALRSIASPLVKELNAQLGQGSVTRIEVKGPDAPSWKFGVRVVKDGRGPRDTYG